jgi:hypothetical protein
MSNNDRWKLQDGRAAQDDDVLPAPPLRRNSKDKHLHNRERRRLKRRRILTKLLSSCLLRFQARATRPTTVADPTPCMTPMSFLLVSNVVAYLDDDLHDRPDVCAENPARATLLPIPETYKENEDGQLPPDAAPNYTLIYALVAFDVIMSRITVLFATFPSRQQSRSVMCVTFPIVIHVRG